jgi:enoyl-CoA hydratase/carnithine racemase
MQPMQPMKGARMADEVVRERRGHVEILTINRPEARNAINGAVSRAMSSIMDELADDGDCWVVILTGSGDKAFSAGMDLKAFSSGEGGDIMGASGGFGGLTERDFAKPLIAAVNGSALAGGLEIMLSCDLVVAAEHAMFGIPEAKRGLIAGAGGLLRLPKRLPLAVAYELAMTGDPIDAARAHALGLVNLVVPAASLLTEALALAERIAANAPLAVRYSKSVMKRAAEAPESEGWKINQDAVNVVFSSADAREGPLAFAEKRQPRWQGK